MSIKIYIADYNVDFRESVRDSVYDNKIYVVGDTFSGNTALEDIECFHPDVIVLGSCMDDMSILDFVRKVKSLECKIPSFIIVNEFVGEELYYEVLGSCATFSFINPWELDKLDLKIREIIDRKYVNENLKAYDNISHYTLETIIKKFLDVFGVSSERLGYNYLLCAIETAYKNPGVFENRHDYLIKFIASKLKTTSSRAERFMIHSILVSWDKSEDKNFSGKFGRPFENMTKCPELFEFIFAIAGQIDYIVELYLASIELMFSSESTLMAEAETEEK